MTFKEFQCFPILYFVVLFLFSFFALLILFPLRINYEHRGEATFPS